MAATSNAGLPAEIERAGLNLDATGH